MVYSYARLSPEKNMTSFPSVSFFLLAPLWFVCAPNVFRATPTLNSKHVDDCYIVLGLIVISWEYHHLSGFNQHEIWLVLGIDQTCTKIPCSSFVFTYACSYLGFIAWHTLKSPVVLMWGRACFSDKPFFRERLLVWFWEGGDYMPMCFISIT